MIDFVRIHYRDKSKLEAFIMSQNNFNELETHLDYHTGEIKYPYKTTIKNIEAVLTEKYGYVKGSLHVFYNAWKSDEEQNYNDFNYSNMVETLDYLSSKIIDFENTPITQLEVGLNLTLDFSPIQFLNYNLLFNNHKKENHNINYRGGGKMLQFNYSQYYIKVYDKGKMFKRKDNILRFEMKLIRKAAFQKMGVFSISDLRDKMVLRKLFNVLLKKYEEMLVIDDYKIKDFSQSDLKLFHKYTNSRFWEIEMEKRSRTTRAKHKKKFNELLKKHDLLNIKLSIKQKLIQKFIHFINN